MPTELPPSASLMKDGVEDLPSDLTVGDILRKERLGLGLSEKQVANKLHITMHYVKALESNHYEKLPGVVFVKGYIKNYAILLGLESSDLLDQYDELNAQQQVVIAESSRLKARGKKDMNKSFVIMSLLVFIGGFLGLWLVNSYFSGNSVAEPSSVDRNETTSDSIRPAKNEDVVSVTNQPQINLHSKPENSADVVETVNNIANSSLAVTEESAQENVSSASSPSVTGLETTAENNTDATLAALTTSLNPNTQTELSTTDAAEALTLSNNVAISSNTATDLPRVIKVEASGNDFLRISFSGKSWVEVNDSDSQKIYQDIRAAGDVLEITGSAPFNILVGDASFTRVSLNGNEADLSDDVRIDNSARFTVGL